MLRSMTRWALVTAGAQGLGEATTLHLARSGYAVLIHYYRSIEAAEAIRRAIIDGGGDAELLRADLGSAKERQAMINLAAERLPNGALQLLVNNLGVYPLEHLLDTTLEQWERTFTLTCTTVFDLTRLALPLLRRADPPARIINLGDSGCDRIQAHDDATAYHIAKLGVNVLTRTYAERLGPERITVNMISPGFLENSAGTPGGPIPLGRMGRFEDIAGALDYLLSDAASYVSGANLVVSGAWNL